MSEGVALCQAVGCGQAWGDVAVIRGHPPPALAATTGLRWNAGASAAGGAGGVGAGGVGGAVVTATGAAGIVGCGAAWAIAAGVYRVW